MTCTSVFYSPVGTGRTNMMDQLAAMIAKAMLFLDAVLAIDTFARGVDIMPSVVEGDGVVNDPAELPFWGCDFVLTVMEFVN